MKKNIIYTVLIALVFFFSSSEVNAAQELTCLYEKGSMAKKVMLVQKADGNLVVYKHKSADATWDSENWILSKAVPRWGEEKFDIGEWFSTNDPKIGKGNLTTCPNSMRTLNNGKGSVRFYKTKSGGESILENQDTKVHTPAVVTSENLDEEDIEDYDIFNSDGTVKSCTNISEDTFETIARDVMKEGIYSTSCLYANDVSDGCHMIVMNINKEKRVNFSQIEPGDYKGYKINDLSWDDSFSYSGILNDYQGVCPGSVYVVRSYSAGYTGGEISSEDVTVISKVYYNNAVGSFKYPYKAQTGVNLITGEALTTEYEVNIGFEKIEILDCDDLFGGSDDLISVLRFIINAFKIAVPLILIGMGTLDFAKAIFAGSEDNMKKAQKKFIQRVVIAVAIFLIPSLLKLVLNIANGIWSNIDTDLCGLL